MDRRRFVIAALGSTLLARPAFAASPGLTVFKSPTCGCCSAWIDHMERAGFSVDARDVDHGVLPAIKTRLGIAPEFASCHTALVGDYVIEGHVPAEDIQRLLQERPEAIGLAVPGMPIGSPGMEMDGQRDPYATLLVLRNGDSTVFQQHI